MGMRVSALNRWLGSTESDLPRNLAVLKNCWFLGAWRSGDRRLCSLIHSNKFISRSDSSLPCCFVQRCRLIPFPGGSHVQTIFSSSRARFFQLTDHLLAKQGFLRRRDFSPDAENLEIIWDFPFLCSTLIFPGVRARCKQSHRVPEQSFSARLALGIPKRRTRISRPPRAGFWGAGAVLAEVWEGAGVRAASKSWHLPGSIVALGLEKPFEIIGSNPSHPNPGPAAARQVPSQGKAGFGARALPRPRVRLPASGFLGRGRWTFIFLKRALGVCSARGSFFPWNAVVCSVRVRSETCQDGEAEERREKPRALLWCLVGKGVGKSARGLGEKGWVGRNFAPSRDEAAVGAPGRRRGL